MNNLIMGRVDNIFQRLGSDVSHIIISNDISPFIDSSFFYLTGISSGIFEESFAVASRDGDVTVITGTLEAESAKESKLDVRVVTGNDSYKKALAEVLGKHKKIGINYGGSTLGDYMRIKKWLKKGRFIDASLAIEKARMVKDDHEIKMIRRAAEISSAAFYPIKEAIKEGVKETEMAAIVNYELMNFGASGSSFDTIFGTGKNSAEPHYVPRGVKISSGDMIVCDYGARYNRYCCDTTRSFILGEAEKRKKDIYNTVLEAQKAAIETIRASVKGSDVYAAASEVIDRRGYKGLFTHGIGHSLGLDVHDSVALRPFSDSRLEENMVLTVEPGVYVPGFGGVRIEDDIIVTKTGCEVLTTAPKGLEDITIT